MTRQPIRRDSIPYGSPAKRVSLMWALMVTTLLLVVFSVVGSISLWLVSQKPMKVEVFGDPMTVGDAVLGYAAAVSSASLRRHLHDSLEYHVYTDARGARVSAPGDETPAQVSLLTVGGSFAWGHGVENEETFTSVVGECLEIPVANFGKAGYGTLQSLKVLEKNIDLAPRVVVYAFIGDHTQRNLAPCAPSYFAFCTHVPHVEIDPKGVPTIRLPGEKALNLQRKRQRYFKAFTGGFSFHRLTIGPEILIDRFRRRRVEKMQVGVQKGASRTAALKMLISDMAVSVREAGATLIVMYVPTPLGEVRKVPGALRRAVEGHDHTVLLDLSESLRAHLATNSPSSLHASARDNHPGATAHRLMADELVNVIISNRLLLNASPAENTR